MTKYILYIIVFSALLSSCSSLQQPSNSQELFDEFWTFVDKNYIYFEEKNVDWDQVYEELAPSITSETTEDELFDAMEEALFQLNDTHNRLTSGTRNAKTPNYMDGYEVHFSAHNVKQNYVVDSLGMEGNLYYGFLEDQVGYIYLHTFNGYGELGAILRELKALGARKIVIDVRGNRGGNSNFVPERIGDLVQERTALGGYIEKNGPGHDDTTDPVLIYAEPSGTFLDLPIDLLINRECYSATSYFAAMMKDLPNVRLIGQVTGGGAGGNLGFQLTNEWLVAVSVSDFLDKEGASIEIGVEPEIQMNNTANDIASGKDQVIEYVLSN